MQTSDTETRDTEARQGRTPRRWPLWAKLTFAGALVATLLAADIALTWALATYGTHFQGMWEQYREATAAGVTYDTLCIGSSVAQEDLHPVIDEVLDTTSFNIAGPGETPWASLRALRIVLDEHPVERVILGTSYNTLCDKPWPNNDLIFIQAETQGRLLGEKASAFASLALSGEYVGDIYSLTFFAPFTITHVDYSPGAVRNNIRNRQECANATEASERLNDITVNHGNGYCNYIGTLDRTHFIYTDLGATDLKSHELREGKWAPFRAMIDLCEERGVPLYVVVMPHPDFELVAFGEDYPQQMAIVQAYAEEHGATYLDFGMAKPELWSAEDSEFRDGAHLNVEGSEHFSRVLSETIARIEAGEDVRDGFLAYDEWDQCIERVTSPALCWGELSEADGGIAVSCGALIGVDSPLEYEVAVGSDETDTWEVVRPWSLDTEVLLPMDHYGTVDIRVRARCAGDDATAIAHVQTFTYYG